MTPSKNTRPSPMAYKESLAIAPTTYPPSPSLSKYFLDNIHNYIKTLTGMTDKHHSDMKTMNDNISDIFQNLTAEKSKT